MPAQLHAALVGTRAAGDAAPRDRHAAVRLLARPPISRPARVPGRHAPPTARRAPVSLPPALRGGDAPHVEAQSVHRRRPPATNRESSLANRLAGTATTHRSRRPAQWWPPSPAADERRRQLRLRNGLAPAPLPAA